MVCFALFNCHMRGVCIRQDSHCRVSDSVVSLNAASYSIFRYNFIPV